MHSSYHLVSFSYSKSAFLPASFALLLSNGSHSICHRLKIWLLFKISTNQHISFIGQFLCTRAYWDKKILTDTYVLYPKGSRSTMRGWGKMLGTMYIDIRQQGGINEEQYPQAAKYYCLLCYKRLLKKKDVCGEQSTKLSKAVVSRILHWAWAQKFVDPELIWPPCPCSFSRIQF